MEPCGKGQVLEKELAATKSRVDKVEIEIHGIREELKVKSIADAKIQQILETMQGTIQLVQTDTREIRTEMMKLILKAIEQNNEQTTYEKTFYRKLIITTVSVLITIVLAIFGINKLFIFN